jgi:hypothetical protein
MHFKFNCDNRTLSTYPLMKASAPFFGICAALLAGAQVTALRGQVVFQDNFESGNMNNWTVRASNPLYQDNTKNIVPGGGSWSAKLTNSIQSSYHNVTPLTADSFKFTCYIYDGAGTRMWNDVRMYSGGAYNSGTLNQGLMIGKQNAIPAGGNINDTYDGTKYQGRIINGTWSGWFNLNLPGVPSRSGGWHRFDIVRGKNADATITYAFYVDGILGRSFTGAYPGTQSAMPDDVIIAGLAAGTSTGDMWTDGILLVQGQAYISAQPEGQTNGAGSTITVSVQGIGAADQVYFQWRKNGLSIAGATNSDFVITNADPTNSGNYSVTVSNSLDLVASSNAYVQVNPLNLITVAPTNQLVNVGTAVTLYAEATGGGTLYYQWKHYGTNIPGATGTGSSSTYNIASATPADAGPYTLTVTNSFGDPPTTSPAAVLTVNMPPVFGAIPDSTVSLGSVFSVTPSVTDDINVQAQPFQAFESNAVGSRVTFCNPDLSGTTGNLVDNLGRTYVTNVFPGGHPGPQVLRVNWNWTNAASPLWLRLTTASSGSPIAPNPVVSFTGPLRFDIYTDKDIKLAVGLRESNATGAIGTDAGGSSAAIEWVGVTGPGSPPSANLTVTAGSWTTVSFDTNSGIASFNLGNGVLDSTTGKGTLEHLALEPADGLPGSYTIYLDNLVSVPNNALSFSLDSAPPGATVDPYTGLISWTPASAGTYNFIVRATDTMALSATQSFNVTVTAAAPGAISIARYGTDVVLDWSGSYTLQSAPDVTGPFTDVPGPVLTGPYTNSIGSGTQFFRLRN